MNPEGSKGLQDWCLVAGRCTGENGNLMELLKAVGRDGASNMGNMELQLGTPWKNNDVEQSWIHRQPGGVGIERLPRYDP